ncbi:MAG TPA: hypothetical protein PKI20_13025 [Verrucomicrobiota bacterium]|nr:hypothetical protein [Verrucomicrobiota bacterium]HQL78619.1 hypothetical protein [Verrucomicrobiota bacterium]
MNAPDRPPMIERSTTVRFLRWLFSWRTLRRMLIGLGWLAVLGALFHGVENWRGRRVWNQYRQALEARGEPLDFKAVIPKPVPDDQNFAATPLVKSWFDPKREEQGGDCINDNYTRADVRLSRPKLKGVPASRSFLDLVAWGQALTAVRSPGADREWKERVEASMQAFEPSAQPADSAAPAADLRIPPSGRLDAASRAQAAPAVLEGLKTNQAMFAELRLASQRPYSRYPVNYDVGTPFAIELPHLKMVRGILKRLQLKACAELALGQSDAALEDQRLLFDLADSIKGEPFLISHLVRLAMLNLALQPVWEGLAEHRWSEAQLQEIQNRLQQYRVLEEVKTALITERAGAISTIELVRQKGPWYLASLGSPEPASASGASVLGRLAAAVAIPQGWYSQEELTYARSFDMLLAVGLGTTNSRVSPRQVKEDILAFEETESRGGFAGTLLGKALRHRVMVSLLLPALGKVTAKTAAAQTAVNQTAIACALERYRLANGHFPERLDALAPQFISLLPNDVLTGEPYKYRRGDGGQFVLYSIGWDEKDDGGVAGETMFDERKGDWVWECPAR